MALYRLNYVCKLLDCVTCKSAGNVQDNVRPFRFNVDSYVHCYLQGASYVPHGWLVFRGALTF